MKRISLSQLSLRLLVPAAAVLAATACDDPFSLGPASVENVVDTTLIHAVSTADIGEPSAFDMIRRSSAVTEFGEAFDFVFDIRAGEPVLVPLGALGLTLGAGLQHTDKAFDEIVDPPSGDYVNDEAIGVAVGDVLIARSRSSTTGCSFLGAIARFGKFRVISIDLAAGEISLELLVNSNCAFRNLEPGVPTN